MALEQYTRRKCFITYHHDDEVEVQQFIEEFDHVPTLQRRHVDLEARTMRVEQSLARPGIGPGPFSSTKTKAGRRVVVLPTVADEALSST